MKALFTAFFLLFGTLSTAKTITYEEYKLVEKALTETFEKDLKPGLKHSLSINLPIQGLPDDYWFNISMKRASYVRVEEKGLVNHRIYLMGGYIRIKGMTPDGLANTACHEIGHGLGGDPKKLPSMGFPGNTVEGQADYYATSVCLPKVLKRLKALRPLSDDPYFETICRDQNKHEYNFCLRLFSAVEAEASFYKEMRMGGFTFQDHSRHVQRELNRDPTYYPDTQCRIDTAIHGILGLERPICWFPSGIESRF